MRRAAATRPPLFAARLCGAHEVYRVGGVQALAALAYGTESIRARGEVPRPGQPVRDSRQEAPRRRWSTSGCPAGPSESMILADETADPRLLALDLIIEAEHGADSQALLVTRQRGDAPGPWRRSSPAGGRAPRAARARTCARCWQDYGGIILARDMAEARGHRQRGGAGAPADRHRGSAGHALRSCRTRGRSSWASTPRSPSPTTPSARTRSSPPAERRRPALPSRFGTSSSIRRSRTSTAQGYDTLRDAAITLADYEGFRRACKSAAGKEHRMSPRNRRRQGRARKRQR